MMNHKTSPYSFELLAPAGSFETFRAVIASGADAVYVGGSQFGARAYAKNFDKEELLEAIDYAHLYGRKVNLTVNTLLKNKEIEEQLYEYLLPYYEKGLDAVIVQDIGAFAMIRHCFPNMEIHTSTQMTITGSYGAKKMMDMGASRIVMARELSLDEISAIYKETGAEIESFIHGALCYCYSGQCLFSSVLGGRSGNRGRCAQPCRLPYEIKDSRGVEKLCYPLSPKDLCTIDLLPEIGEAGVYSLKIEGRMKQTEYAAGVVSIYRKAIDRLQQHGKEAYYVSEKEKSLLFDFGNRSGFTDGYYVRHNGKEMLAIDSPKHQHAETNFVIPEMPKHKITGEVIVTKQNPLVLKLQMRNPNRLDEVLKVEVEGPIIEEAQNKSATSEEISSVIGQLGNTQFVLEELKIHLDSNVFVPKQFLKKIRRDGIEKLESCILREYFENRTDSKTPICLNTVKKNELQGSYEGPQWIASCNSMEQLDVVCESDIIHKMYINLHQFNHNDFEHDVKTAINRIVSHNKKVYLSLPNVMRKATTDFYFDKKNFLSQLLLDGIIEGFVAKSLDGLGFLDLLSIPRNKVVLDSSIYQFSNRTIDAYELMGYQNFTYSLEQNVKELKHMTQAKQNTTLVVYGYYPLMTSAQCLQKTSDRCIKQPGLVTIKDRMNKTFYAKNYCSECYNVIYNSTPTNLIQEGPISLPDIGAYRLDFTIENQKETKQVLDALETGVALTDYTKGHWKRGVE